MAKSKRYTSWTRPGSGFTLLFEAFAMLPIEYEMPINMVARTLPVVPGRIWAAFNLWIEKGVEKMICQRLNQDFSCNNNEHQFLIG